MKRTRALSFMTSMFLVIIGFTFLPMLALSVYTTVSVKSFAADLSSYELTETAKLLGASLHKEVQGGADPVAVLTDYGARTKFRLTLIARDGNVLYDSHGSAGLMENHIARPEIRLAFETGIGRDYRRSSTTGLESTYAAIRLDLPAVTTTSPGNVVLRVSLPLPLVDARFKQQSNELYLAMVWIFFTGMVAAWFFSKRLRKPLVMLEAIAGQWATGNFDSHAKIRSPLEMVKLSESMNSMADLLQIRLKALTEKKQELKAILEAMGEALLVSNQNGTVEMWNPEAELLFQGLQGIKTQAEGITAPNGKSILELSKSSDLAALEIRCRHGAREEQTITVYGIKPLTLQVHGAPLPNKRGAVLVLSDISRMVQLETVRKDFVANVSHELKTPIQSIKGFTESLQGETGADPEARERFLNIIQRNTQRMEAIIADLLVLARLEHVEAEGSFMAAPVEIAQVVAMATSMLLPPGPGKAEAKIVHEGSPTSQVLGNAGLLEQAILNLLDNAIRYSPEGTAITVRWAEKKGMLELSVLDQGPGIPLKDQDRIFERFYRVEKSRTREANVGGTGLGLAIVRHVAQLHGGTAQVESVQGKGSTFSLTLPLAPLQST